MGAPSEPIGLSIFSCIAKRRTVAGSFIGGVRETQEMLDFCGKHNIVSDIELINPDQITEMFDRVIAADVKYRAVIDMTKV